MKTRKIGIAGCLMALLCACETTNWEQDFPNEEQPGNPVGNGKYVVDYTVGGDLPAGRAEGAEGRIQSLTYLLYANSADGYRLSKRRDLLGLNDQEWPMNRDNMSWEEREALKDTLSTANSYKAVFIANAHASIWNNEEVLQEVAQEAKFDDARLYLPTQIAFNSSNMYYLAVEDITLAVGDTPPMNYNITLQRMINKVEFALGEGLDATDLMQACWEAEYVAPETNNGKVLDAVNELMDKLADKFEHSTPVMPQDIAENNLAKYLNNAEKRNAIVKALNENDTEHKELVFANIRSSLTAHLTWTDKTAATAYYNAGTCATSMNWLKESFGAEVKTNLTATKTETGTFAFYTFCNGQHLTTNSEFNKVQTLELKVATDDTAPLTLAVGKNPWEAHEDGNRSARLDYSPELSVGTGDKIVFNKPDFDLQTTFGWDWENTTDFPYKDDFTKEAFQTIVNQAIHEVTGNATETYNQMTLTLQLPPMVLTDKWKEIQ